jgi:predicted nucleotidyltransferase
VGFVDELLTPLKGILQGRADIRLALLFGSRARGTARPESDVDVAVEAPGVDLLDLSTELSAARNKEVQVVDLQAAGHTLLKALLRESVVLHQGRPGAAAQWRTGALTRVELDAPFHERMNQAFLRRLATRGLGYG